MTVQCADLLDTRAHDLQQTAAREHDDRITALRRQIAETDRETKRVLHSLELFDEPDQDLIRDINTRRSELREQKANLERQLDEAEQAATQVPNTGLIDTIPVGDVRVETLPTELARELFEAFQLELNRL